MSNANKLIKVSAILYLLSSLLIIPYEIVLGGLLFTIGLLLLSYNFLSLEELNRKKVSIIVIIILSFILDLPSAILLLIAINEINSVKQINNNSPPITQTSTESKRIDLLLKLGLGMILISGILFATTSWEIISDLVKVIALILMGTTFLGLSAFSEKKLKIESTTKAYFILGLAFFLLTWIGVGYFGVFSEWFSYAGAGKNLVYLITFVLLGFMLYLIGHKFKEQEYTYLAHATIYLSIYHIFAFIGLDLLQAALGLSIISLVINLLPLKQLKTIKEVNYIASYLYWSIVLTQCFEANSILVLITCLVNICNLLFLSFKTKTTTENIISISLSYILIIIGILKLNLLVDTTFILFLVVALFSLFIKYNKLNQSKSLIITNQIIYNVISTILIIVLATSTSLYLLLASLIYVIINILNSLDLYKSDDEIDYRYQPIVLFIMFMSITNFINKNLIATGELIACTLTTLTYAGIYQVSKTKKVKDYYYIFLIIASLFTYIINISFMEIIPAIGLLIAATYLFFVNKEKSIGYKIFYYIFILLNIIGLIDSISPYGITSTMNSLIVLIVFIILTLLIKQPQLKIVNYIAVAFPLYGLVNSFEINPTLNIIVNNLFYLYLLFLVVKLIIKDKSTRDIVGTIGLTIITLDIITTQDLLIGLYIGLLGIIIIFITFNEEEYKKMFYCGVIITIINIIIQLWELWTLIPFYLYLLLVGIIIVAFVTYKEIKKKDAKETPTEVEKAPQKKISQSEMSEEEALSIPLLASNEQTSSKESREEQVLPKDEDTEKQPVNVSKTTSAVANFCPSCGTSNLGGKFCRKCGRNLLIK